MSEERFTFFWNDPFSQWHPSPFEIDGVRYVTAEQYMMAEKARLFGDQATAHAHIVEIDGQAAATAVWFLNFSTWDGVSGIYLEDLFVRPAFRRRGLARTLLATLAAECRTHGYTRLSWAVLNWNVDAIALYDAVGGTPQTEWTTYRVSGPQLAELASESDRPV